MIAPGHMETANKKSSRKEERSEQKKDYMDSYSGSYSGCDWNRIFLSDAQENLFFGSSAGRNPGKCGNQY